MGTQTPPQPPAQARLDEQQGQEAQEQKPLTAEELKAQEALMKSLEERRERTSNSDLLKLIVDSATQAGYAKQIVEAELIRDAFDQDWRLAKVFALSGQFSDIRKLKEMAAIATAMSKVQLGRSWGLTPGDAIQFIYFTNGRPAVMNELVAAKLLDAGWDWDIQYQREGSWEKPEGRCTGCRLWIKKDGKLLLVPLRNADGSYMTDKEGAVIMRPVAVEFTKKDADAAKIYENGQQVPLSAKWNFVSWPEDMYFWRCIGRLKKRHAANVLRGARPQAEADDVEAEGESSAPLALPPATGKSAREIMKEEVTADAQAKQSSNGTVTAEPSVDDEPKESGQGAMFADAKTTSDAPAPTGRRSPVRPIDQR